MSTQDILNEREKTHGDFTQNTKVMQTLKRTCRATPNWDSLSPDKQEAIEMICHKLGRILCGNPNTLDHWQDISGYSTLISNSLSQTNHV